MGLWNEPIFQALVGVMGDNVFVLSNDGVVTGYYCNNEVLLAESEGEPLGTSFKSLFPDEVALSFSTAIQALKHTGLPQSVSFTLIQANKPSHFAARVAPLDLEDARILIVIWDETGQTLARRAVEINEQVYRLLERNSSDVITVEKMNGEFLYVSPSVQRLIAYTPKELRGRKRAELVHQDDLEKIRQLTEDGKLLSEQGMRLKLRLKHEAGHWVWVETEVRQIEWQGRRALLNTTRDITLRHQAEEKAAEMMEELEKARSKAVSANRAKSEFLASTSHDLRTPLHGLLGMAELMEQTHLTQEQQDYLAAIQESGQMLLSRLNDLLDLSKIESGRLDLEEIDFDLVEAVEGLLDILGSQAMEKGIQLFCHVPPEVPPMVHGDPRRLRQILINLIGNAIKFTDQGEVDVRVSARDDGRLCFSVRDTGCGLSEEQANWILDRGDSTKVQRAGRRQRAGVGLTIAKQLVALMGGELQVESHPISGTTFFFALPLQAAKRATRDVMSFALEGRRILATDDNVTNRQLIREILEQAGAEVELTSGGVETIRNLLDDPAYDCVILNANLPDLDGLSTAAMIRSNRTVEQLPLVLMVSSSEPEEIKRCKQLNVNAMLMKPVRRHVLVSTIQEVVTSGCVRNPTAQDHDGTILVVEDNDLNLRLARGILRRAGYHVVSARDGKEALQQLDQHDIDAVLMDIQLPDMDGIEATAQIRKTPGWKGIPIIAMTAYAMKGDAERFMEAGVDDCLSKPVNQGELLSVLQRELSSRRHNV